MRRTTEKKIFNFKSTFYTSINESRYYYLNIFKEKICSNIFYSKMRGQP